MISNLLTLNIQSMEKISNLGFAVLTLLSRKDHFGLRFSYKDLAIVNK